MKCVTSKIVFANLYKKAIYICKRVHILPYFRGTQRIVSVNYLFERLLIPSDFLKRIVTSNFRDMRNLMSVVFGLLKMSFWVPKKGQLSFSERL